MVRSEGCFDVQGVRHRFVMWEYPVAAAPAAAGAPIPAAAPARVPGAAPASAAAAGAPAAAAAVPACVPATSAAATAPPATAAPSLPVIALHGFAQSADSWDQVAALLAQGRRVYALDLVGHGGSSVPASPFPYALQTQGQALLAFARYVRDDNAGVRPAVIGYSMGGRVALSALVDDAAAFAQTISVLILESAGLGPASKADRARATTCDADGARQVREAGVAAFMDEWEKIPLFATQRTLPVAVRARVRAERLANDAEALARTFEHAGQHTMPSRAQVLAALQDAGSRGVDVRYLAGSLDQAYRTLSAQLATVPGASVQLIEGAGHNAHLEAPATFARTIEATLNPEAQPT